MSGFVDEQQPWSHQQGTGNRESLLHPMRVHPDRHPAVLTQSDFFENLMSPYARRLLPQTMQTPEEEKVLEPREAEVERPITCGYQPEPLPQLARTRPNVHAHGPDDPFRGKEQPGHDPEQGCLARPVRAEQRMNV